MTNTSKVAWARLDCLHSPKIWVMWGPLSWRHTYTTCYLPKPSTRRRRRPISDLGLFDPSYSLSRHACYCFQDCARWCVWSPFFLFIFVLFLSWVFTVWWYDCVGILYATWIALCFLRLFGWLLRCKLEE